MSQYCTFKVDDFFFGVPVEQVQEVARHQEMTAVPLAAPEVRGLINLRGQIITALDLRRRLGLADRTAGQRPPMNILINTGEGIVSLLVDQIEDVLGVQEETIESPPETLKGPARDLVTGASKQKDRLLLILDTDKAVELAA